MGIFARNHRLAISSVIYTLFLAGVSSTHAAPLDFDDDGMSDRAAVNIEQSGDLTWSATGALATSSLGTFGRNGDNLIPGPWLNAGEPIIGFVRASDSGVSWNIGNQSATFGLSTDTLLSGGDFDGDGRIDAAFARSSNGRLVWHVNTNLFSGGATQTIRFGRRANVPFFANPGSTHDWLAVLIKPREGDLRIELQNPQNAQRRRVNRISRTLTNYARPVPIRHPSNRDGFLFVRKGSTRTTAIVLSPRGKKLAQASVNESVDVVVGEYLTDAGEEFAFATSAGFLAINPVTKRRETIAAPSGVAVDEINVNIFDTTDDSGLPIPRDTCYEGDPTDGFKTGFIWKPASDTQFGAVVILPGIYKNKIREVRTTRTNGDLIRTLAFKGNANPDPGGLERPHYIDRSMQGGQYRRQYRSIVVEAELKNGACLAYPIDNPANRVD